MNNNSLYCQNCGFQNNPGNQFCQNCGTPLNSVNNNVNNNFDNNMNNNENNNNNINMNNGNMNMNNNMQQMQNVQYQIKGGNLPYVVLNLSRGQQIICESGSMSWKSDSVTMDTTSNGGVGKVFSRMFTGEKLFQNIYTAQTDNSYIAFSSSFPGAIMPIEIRPGQDVICQKSSFLAGTAGVELSIHFNKKIGVGVFAGEGFIMQRMASNGMVFIEIDGSMEERILQPGEKIVISTGHLVMMDASCQISVETVKGLKNIFLGGEGLFNTIITGPGKVVMQSMPISKMANTLYPYMPIQTANTASNVIDIFSKK